ncbi:arsenic-transporting ATPase [Leptolyngbya valderiana BDU 20041]|nr:arsenic-transporting ATPase [Leptolyngbya valderiana BDU 20041]
MAQILTFLGKGGTGRTTLAIATAKYHASFGRRVLLASQGSGPEFSLLLGASVASEPTEIEPNLQAIQFYTPYMLEQGWEQVKSLEAKYLRTPFFKEVYGQELAVLPGMDSAFAINAVREYDASGKYDVIVYDGTGDRDTLRMLGIAEIAGWYLRRFRQVLEGSDIVRALSPFVQPVSSAVLNVDWSQTEFTPDRLDDLLGEGKQTLSNAKRIAAYLVTTDDPAAIAVAKYRWGEAQQIGLTVGGIVLNRGSVSETIAAEFAPLTLSAVPTKVGDDWQPIIENLPDFESIANAPKPMEIDLAAQTVRLFLPGFDKKQVKLIQSGPEVTVEAGEQRHNIFLPPALQGKSVKGAKFQNQYLTISF